jgi:hypothetical protein
MATSNQFTKDVVTGHQPEQAEAPEDKGEPTTLTLIVWGVLVMLLAGWLALAVFGGG